MKRDLFRASARLAVAFSTMSLSACGHAQDMPKKIPVTTESIVVGMGCFWGGAKRMGALPGVLSTEVGYAGGTSPAPTYEKVQAEAHSGIGDQSYAEVVKVTFDPTQTTLGEILAGFWENHNPTQGDRQGNDVGSNYRSAIFYIDAQQKAVAEQTRDAYQQVLTNAGYGSITTKIAALTKFYPAEEYHQHYLEKHPLGYGGEGGTQGKTVLAHLRG
jgi:peptide methionine sulfoxide reductase msrA/msrB